MLRYKTEWVKLLGGSSCIGFVLVLLLNLSHVAQLLHKSTVSVFLYWLWGLCSEILRWGRAAQLPPAWVLMVPVLPKDENWLSAATVRLVTFGPIRTPQEGAGLRGARSVLAVPVSVGLQWRRFMLSLCLRKSAKPAGDRYLREACRPRIPSLRALGTTRYLRSWARSSCFPLSPGTAPLAVRARALAFWLVSPSPSPSSRLRFCCSVTQSHRWCAWTSNLVF